MADNHIPRDAQPTPELQFCHWLKGYLGAVKGRDELTPHEANTIRGNLNELLSSDGEPSNGKQPLMASRPAPPVPSDPKCSAGNGGQRRQYYYRMNGCNATHSQAPDCVCWHDEGTGPYADRLDAPVTWRTINEPQPPSRLTFCETCNGNTMHRRASIVNGVQTFECQRCALTRPELGGK